MSTITPDNFAAAGRLLADRVASIRRKHILTQFAFGGSIVGLAVLIGLTVSMTLDFNLKLGFAERGTILFIVALVVAALLWRYLVRGLLRTPDLDQAALLAEREIPGARNRLISAIQLTRGDAPPGVSPGMIGALVREADEMVAGRDLSSVVRTDGVVAAFCTAFGLAVAMIGTLAYLGPTGSALIQRALLVPGVELPARTGIELVTHQPIRVARGEDVELRFRTTGVIPTTGFLDVRFTETDARSRIDLARDEKTTDEFFVTLRRVAEPVKFAVTLGDGVAGAFDVEVVDRPAVKSLQFAQASPGYTRLGRLDKSPGDLNLLAGSKLELAVGASKPVARGSHLLLHGPAEVRIPLVADPADPTRLRLEMPASLPAGVTGASVHLVDDLGFASLSAAVYPISVVPDEPPVVNVAKPDRAELLVTPWAKVPITFDASDDIGLAGVRVRYFVTRQSRLEIPESAAAGITQTVFAKRDFTGKTDVRVVPNVDANWGGDPPVKDFPRDDFTVRWSGVLLVPQAGEYQFRIDADDRARVFFGEDVVIDTFVDQNRRESTKMLKLQAGFQPIRVDFREFGGEARCKLLWRQGDRGWSTVPKQSFFPHEASARRAIEGAMKSTDAWRPDATLKSTDPLPKLADATWRWDLAPLSLAPGDSLTAIVEAVDANDITGPGVGKWKPIVIRIGSPEEVRADVLNRLGDYMQQIDEVEKRQEDLATEIGKILGR
jgi:uncharacterized membrane protein